MAEVCGQTYTKKIEDILKDVEISHNLNNAYHKQANDRGLMDEEDEHQIVEI